jgi:hypothetical protein
MALAVQIASRATGSCLPGECHRPVHSGHAGGVAYTQIRGRVRWFVLPITKLGHSLNFYLIRAGAWLQRLQYQNWPVQGSSEIIPGWCYSCLHAHSYWTPVHERRGLWAPLITSLLRYWDSGVTLITPSNPAAAGEVIVLYATGLGDVQTAVATGTSASRTVAVQRERISAQTCDGSVIRPNGARYGHLDSPSRSTTHFQFLPGTSLASLFPGSTGSCKNPAKP